MAIVDLLDVNKDTTVKTTAWFAINDAKRKSEANMSHYTDAEVKTAERIEQFVRSVFPTNRVYLTYRKKFIAVKVENVTMAEASSTQSQLLEDLCDLSHVSIVANGTNVIFRVGHQTTKISK